MPKVSREMSKLPTGKCGGTGACRQVKFGYIILIQMPQVTPEETIGIALHHHQAGHLAEAECMYRQVLDGYPGCVEAWRLLGILAGQVGRPKEAVQLLQRAIAIDSTNAEAHVNLGVALQAAGRTDEAIAAHLQATRLNPASANTFYNLGTTYQSAGQLRRSDRLPIVDAYSSSASASVRAA